jgi:hypothetical protein
MNSSLNIKLDINEDILAQCFEEEISTSKSTSMIILNGIKQSFEKTLVNPKIINWKINYEMDMYCSYIEPDSLYKLSAQGSRFNYLRITINTDKSIEQITLDTPKYIIYEDFDYTDTISVKFFIDKKELKTKTQFRVEIKQPFIPPTIFSNIYKKMKNKCAVECSYLQEKKIDTTRNYNWWTSFICKICGREYLCSCFKNSISKFMTEKGNDKLKIYDESWKEKIIKHSDLLNEISYKNNICHICNNKMPAYFYNDLFVNSFYQKYERYIKNVSIEKDISMRNAENIIREKVNYPKIGDKWQNETYLYNVVKLIFYNYDVYREATPEWLNRQRIDIFIPKLKIAIEYQGEQHYKPVSLFGGEEEFKKIIERDSLKKKLCTKNGVQLIYFRYNEKLTEQTVRERLQKFIKLETYKE